MAEKTKLIIISDCRVPDFPFHEEEKENPHHVEKGQTFEVDLQASKYSELIANLMHAGRVAVATPEVVKAIQKEIAEDKKKAEKLAKQFAPAAALTAALTDADILRLATERGLIKKA